MTTLLKAIGVLATSAALFVGCSFQHSKSTDAKEADQSLFSNRPVGITDDLYVITLEHPALLTVAEQTSSGLVVPEDAKKALLAEQTRIEQKIKTLSPKSEIIYRYRFVLNGLAVFGPPELASILKDLPGLRAVDKARSMDRPQTLNQISEPELDSTTTSVSYIGTKRAQELGLTGKGIRIGILDTGIDYTHSMLGGTGNPGDFRLVRPDRPSSLFPNSKVVGGVDLVGSDFDSSALMAQGRKPVIDENPIDEAGHGTHVAGTVAGIGDGKNTYSGVAPDATLYGIKVFGKAGTTADAVVIAGFEFAVDPNQDMDPTDKLDVVNLSLGGGFGQPQILYAEATRNITRAGVAVVASAGNSGPVDYIVGAPSTASEALSVAASVDGSAHNWQFSAVRVSTDQDNSWLVKAVEGPISKSVLEIGSVEGALYFIGIADQDLNDAQKAKLSGNVALIMRGKIAFTEKLRRAREAGAIGAIVINTEPGAFQMGGEDKFDIPAIMVTPEMGAKIRREMAKGEVRVEFKTGERIFEPSRVDTITDFSSKGPRSEDNLFKPEIAAPGDNIISAEMGSGTRGVAMSGTSMAAPHMTGVMALLKQSHPTLSPSELKSLAMNSSKILTGQTGPVALTLQGAGRVQVDLAIKAPLVLSPQALSLGQVQVGSSTHLSRALKLKNISDQALTLTVVTEAPSDLNIQIPRELKIPAHSEISVQVEVDVSMGSIQDFSAELGGQVYFLSGDKVVAHWPALAIATQSSMVQGQAPSPTGLTLTNSSPSTGYAFAFNLIGEDQIKPASPKGQEWKNRSCDLQSAGYRVVVHPNAMGVPTEFLQVGFKLHQPVTTWVACEVSALIDADGDGQADQELGGASGGSLEGLGTPQLASVLLDAPKARSVREAYEVALANGQKDASLDYTSSILEVAPSLPVPLSTFILLETPLASVRKGVDGKIHLKVASQAGGGDAIEADDFLGTGLGEWTTIAGDSASQAYQNLPEMLEVGGHAQQTLSYQKGSGPEKMVIYYPNNSFRVNEQEYQSQIL